MSKTAKFRKYKTSEADAHWIDLANCKGNGDPFFEEDDEVAEQIAKDICKSCPFKAQCLDLSFRVLNFGVWGGFNDKERKKLRSQKNKDIKILIEVIQPQLREVAIGVEESEVWRL